MARYSVEPLIAESLSGSKNVVLVGPTGVSGRVGPLAEAAYADPGAVASDENVVAHKSVAAARAEAFSDAVPVGIMQIVAVAAVPQVGDPEVGLVVVVVQHHLAGPRATQVGLAHQPVDGDRPPAQAHGRVSPRRDQDAAGAAVADPAERGDVVRVLETARREPQLRVEMLHLYAAVEKDRPPRGVASITAALPGRDRLAAHAAPLGCHLRLAKSLGLERELGHQVAGSGSVRSAMFGVAARWQRSQSPRSMDAAAHNGTSHTEQFPGGGVFARAAASTRLTLSV